MKKELSKLYEPNKVEDKIYKYWLDGGFFHAEPDSKKEPYCIVIPPPNITGQLHMGHALDETLQDILIRWKRMSGYAAEWIPGTDHASIATEAKIVEAMRKEGLTKDDIGRDGFLERAWDWKKKYGGRIVEQLKKLGSSCDWDRERFTMDEGCSKAVKEVFINYYNKGLIYRGERIINWCPHCRTSISNAEVEYEDQAGHFWHLKYPLTDGSGYVELATTRPETLLGDTAVAVNPKDERYKDIVGKTLTLPLVGREIPVVADSYVDMEFGTGVVKITPAHDPNDFEVGKRHNLPVINVLTEDAKIVDDYPEYAGMDRYEARKKIVEDLEKGGFLAYVEDHEHNVGTCYRCGTTVEPRVSLQWFVKMDELAKPAIKAVEDGSIKFVPERFEKNYLNWMNDIRDWCISRQLWWGHQIPAFYCDDCGETVVTKEDHACCPKCGKEMRQDPDTLDTWFSSALWPFSTLGWPDKTEELEYFYPTNTLVTGYDIIPFWVSRMIVAGMENMKQKPFDTVLIHGLVRDSQGRKMSKSLGNGIDPLVIIDQYGADALRFMLATGNAPGNDMRFIEDKVKSSRNFANKIWNAARFIMMNLPDDFKADKLPENLNVEDKWVISKFNTLAKEVNDNLDKFELGVAVSKLYDFIWDIYCDWYIELTKPRIAFRETIRKKAQVQGKHKKQSGGAGQYGVVNVRFEPGAADGKFEFVDAVVGGAVPRNFIPSVEKGLRENIVRGVLAGYPMVHLRATLHDGSYHPVDSSEMAFKIAGSMAFKEACQKADPTLLEPIMKVCVIVPEEYMGDVIGDLNKRRGRVMGMDPTGDGNQVISAEVPMAEMGSYAIDLRSMTQSRGSFTLHFVRYEDCPPAAQEKAIAEAKALQAAEEK